MGKTETKEVLRARLRRQLVECGIDPDLESYKQLQSDAKLIDVCEKRVTDIARHKAEIEKLKPKKANLAEEAGLSRTSISESHNPNLFKIYEKYFPKESNDTVPRAEYDRLNDELKRAKKRAENFSITEAKYLMTLDDNKKLENIKKLQAESIKNLVKIITGLKQKYMEVTGEVLEIDINKAINDESYEEEDLRRKIVVPKSSSHLT